MSRRRWYDEDALHQLVQVVLLLAVAGLLLFSCRAYQSGPAHAAQVTAGAAQPSPPPPAPRPPARAADPARRHLGNVLLLAAAGTLALAALRQAREGRRRRDLQGDALALLGLPEDTRTPLVGPGLVLLVAGLLLVAGGHGR